jgi:hypothetical protein
MHNGDPLRTAIREVISTWKRCASPHEVAVECGAPVSRVRFVMIGMEWRGELRAADHQPIDDSWTEWVTCYAVV